MKDVESILDIEVNQEARGKSDPITQTQPTILKVAAGVKEGDSVIFSSK